MNTPQFSPVLSLLLSYLFWGGLITTLHGQDLEKTNQSLVTEEYLTQQSFAQLTTLEDDSYENGQIQDLWKITEFHIHKAKLEKDSIEVARGYYYRTIIEDSEKAIAFADSIIHLTNNSNHTRYPTIGYLLKAGIFYDKGDYGIALNIYLKAYDLAIKKGNVEDEITSTIAIGAIKNMNGQAEAAAEIYRSTLKKIEDKSQYDEFYEDYSLLMFNLSLAELRLGRLDSAKTYYINGMNRVSIRKDRERIVNFTMLGAEIDYFEKNYEQAEDTLEKYINEFDGNERATKLYFLAKINTIEKQQDKAFRLYLEIDSIVSKTGEPIEEIKDVYQNLAMYYETRGDYSKEIDYLQKLIHHDSIKDTSQKNIFRAATFGYDIPFLKLEKERAEQRLRSKERVVIYLVIIAILSMGIGTFYIIRNRMIGIRMDNLIAKGLAERDIMPIPSAKSTQLVPEEIKISLLEKLKEFEQSDRYLNKDLKLQDLAAEFETNTSYLSTIINHYKNMSFPNYLKELRVKKAVERLTHDPAMMRYNYQGLAELFGFKSGDSFSKAFHKATGIYPSHFIKEVKTRQKNVDL